MNKNMGKKSATGNSKRDRYFVGLADVKSMNSKTHQNHRSRLGDIWRYT